MATIVNNAVNSTASFYQTPQADDDLYNFMEDALLAASCYDDDTKVVTLDVMSNDLGGKAKALWSIDNGDFLTDLLVNNVNSGWETTAQGNQIRIVNGRIEFNISNFLSTAGGGTLQGLSQNDVLNDSFTYAIRLANGALSTATVYFNLQGQNDAPVVSGTVRGAATEDGPASTLDALANASDVDDGTALLVVNVPASLPAGVSYDAATHAFTLDPSNDAYQYLALGQTTTVTVNYSVGDGIATAPASVAWTVTGTNDMPMAIADQALVREDTLPNPVSGNVLTNDTDVDTLDTHSVTAVNGSAAKVGQDVAGTYGMLHLNADGGYSYTLDNTKAAVQALSVGQTVHDVFSYADSDNNGATSWATLNVTVTGSNDAPTLQSPVPTGQVFDDTSLTLTATMAFAEFDLLDMHTVTFTALTSGSIGTFTPAIGTDSTNSGQGSIGLTYHLTEAQFMAAGGHAPDHQAYLVTIDDHHGGTSSQIVSIPLAQILSGVGGGSTTTQPPVFTTTSPPTFSSSHNLGQITDNPFVLQGPGPGNLFAQGTLAFSDPDGGNHHASVGFATVAGHFIVDSYGMPHPLAEPPIIGTWQVSVLEPNQVQWTYTLPETAARSMSGGETLSLLFPVTVAEDGTGQSTQMVKIDLLGTDEATFLLAPNTQLTSGSDLLPYLLPPNQLSHLQTQDFSITENPSVTGSSSVHHLSGTIAFVDPDKLDHPTVTMTVADMTHDLDLNPGDGPFNAAMQPLMAGFHYTVEQFGNYGMIHWTYDLQDSVLDFLAEGSTVTASATFNIGALAGGPGGGGSLSMVNVTLHGENDAPVIQGSNTTIANVALFGSTSGSFTFDDPDWYPDGHIVGFVPHNPDSHGFIFGGTPVETGVGGSEQVTWNYKTDFGPGTPVVGQHDVWDVVVQDHFGASATHTLDFLLV